MVEVIKAEDISLTEKKNSSYPNLMPIRELLKKTFVLYKDNFLRFLSLLLVAVLSSLPLLLVVGSGWFRQYFAGELGNVGINITNIIIGLLLLIVLAFVVYINVVVQVAVFVLLEQEKKQGLLGLLRKARGYFWKFVLVNLAVGLFTFFWSLLFIIPGLIMVVYYSLSLYALLFEDFRSTAALRRSRELVRGYWWSVTWRLSVLSILIWFVFVLLSVPLWFLPAATTAAQVWSWVINFIALLLTPIGVIFSYLLFKDLRGIKGASKLVTRPRRGASIAVAIAAGLLFLLLLLIALFAVPWQQSSMRSRDFQRLSDIELIKSALSIYYHDAGKYPLNLTFGKELSYQGKIYLPLLPQNPRSDSSACPATAEYEYQAVGDGAGYVLAYCLEQDYDQYKSGWQVINSTVKKDDILDVLNDYTGVTASGDYAYIELPGEQAEDCSQLIIYPTNSPNSELVKLAMCADQVESLAEQDGWLVLSTKGGSQYRLNVSSGEEKFINGSSERNLSKLFD